MTADSEIILVDGADNSCFGCSPFNEQGLKLVWRRTGGGEVEAHYTVADHWNGAPGVVHGGVQAALLDETMGVAIHRGSADRADRYVVTANIELDYRRPVATGVPLVLRARATRSEGRSHFAEGEIVARNGTVLTRARSRWVEVPPPENIEAVRGTS